MKLLLDQDVYAITVRFLRDQGHDVVCVAELGLSRAADEKLLALAGDQGRVFVTRDRDYGGLVFVKGLGAGVLYLRILPSTTKAVHAELARVFGMYSNDELRGAFVVIEPDRHRFRHPLPK